MQSLMLNLKPIESGFHWISARFKRQYTFCWIAYNYELISHLYTWSVSGVYLYVARDSFWKEPHHVHIYNKNANSVGKGNQLKLVGPFVCMWMYIINKLEWIIILDFCSILLRKLQILRVFHRIRWFLLENRSETFGLTNLTN